MRNTIIHFLRIKRVRDKVLCVQSIKFFLVTLLIGIAVGIKGQSDKNVHLIFDIESEETTFLFKVSRSGDSFCWQGNTFAWISCWDNLGNELSQDVTSSNGWLFNQKPNETGYTVNCIHPKLGFSFTINIIPKDDILIVSVPAKDILETGEARLKELRLLPYFGAAEEGDEGYMVIPKDVGVLCDFKGKKPANYDIPIYKSFTNCNMPLFGMVQDKRCFAGIITNGQFDANLHINTHMGRKGVYSIDPKFTLRSFAEEKRLNDDLCVQYHFLAEGANWLDIAKRYRKYNAECRQIRPLKERIKSSPELAYSAQALEVRMRMGAKPVPTPVLEQTPEDEPPIRVFLTFNKLRDIFDEFYNQGIDKTEFCVVGWHSGGHDGRFPQLFPVENAFGTEKELRRSIAYGQSLGYQVVSHDDWSYMYHISKYWNKEYIRKDRNGQLQKGATNRSNPGGQSYMLCRIPAYEIFAKRDEPRVRELGFKGLHYNDVISIVGPFRCYDLEHPLTLRQDAETTNKILSFSKEIFGGVQSEGPLDFTAAILDRVLYISIRSKKSPIMELPYVDTLVPLYPAVYHGTLLYNIWNDCFNSEPGNEYYLKNIEYGGMPLAYFYGYFALDSSRNWLGDRDLRYDNAEGLKKAVSSLKPVYNDLQKLKHLQMEFIEGHRKLVEGVFETLYSNGERVVVNYNNVSYRIASGEEIPPLGFKLIPNQN